jgi:radical SAM superfamily enzyme YgiQ (UPF0313 family)
MRLASLVPDDIPVEIWDEDLMRLPLETLNAQDLVGISANTLLIDRAKAIAGAAQARGATVAIGGTHATLAPDEVAGWADVVAVGEGYRTWPQIISDFDRQSLQPRYSDEEWADLGSGVAELQERVLRQVNEHRNYLTPYLEITRGCPRNCTFCTAIRVSGRRMRLRPVEEVVAEIERRRLRRFFLTDDNFGLNFRLNPDYMERLLRALAKLPLHGWTSQAEQMVADYPDLLDLAREAHLDKFLIGFESVNPDNRKELGGKGRGELSKTREVINTIHKHGIGVVGLFVYGFDSDTPEIFRTAAEFVDSSQLDGVSATILTPYPGTEQREELLRTGRILPHPAADGDGLSWARYDTNHVTFVPAKMSVEQLSDGYDWLCRRLYTPRRILQRGTRALLRHPVPRWRRRLISSYSTDIGYRREFEHRYL